MDVGPRLTVTWEQIVTVARALEDAAYRNNVAPQDGARLVRLVLEFNEHVIGGDVHLRKTKPTGAPPAPAETG